MPAATLSPAPPRSSKPWEPGERPRAASRHFWGLWTATPFTTRHRQGTTGCLGSFLNKGTWSVFDWRLPKAIEIPTRRYVMAEHDSSNGCGIKFSSNGKHPVELSEHIVEVISDSGEGAQKCAQSFATVAAKMGNGVWTVEIIPAEIQPSRRDPAAGSKHRGRQRQSNSPRLRLCHQWRRSGGPGCGVQRTGVARPAAGRRDQDRWHHPAREQVGDRPRFPHRAIISGGAAASPEGRLSSV